MTRDGDVPAMSVSRCSTGATLLGIEDAGGHLSTLSCVLHRVRSGLTATGQPWRCRLIWIHGSALVTAIETVIF